MTWEEKTKMCQHFNNQEYEQAIELFLQNIDRVDNQDIDMFFTGIDLTKETLSKSIVSHKIILDKLKSSQSSSFRIAMRMAYYEELIANL